MRFSPSSALRRRGLELALVGVAAIWGLTFVMVKESVARVPVYSFNGLRFLLAAVVLGGFCLPGLRRLGREGLRHGAILGAFLFAGYAFQTVGLQYTQASRAGFITGMFVVFTPLLSALVLRRRPGPVALLGVALATVGLGLLSVGQPGASLTGGASSTGLAGGGTLYGDLLVVGCALSFAAHIVGLGAWSRRHAALPLTVVQLLVAGLLHSVVAVGVESPTSGWDRYVIGAILVTALLASAGAFWIQTAAQRIVPPTRTALILVMEPVFAGVFGYLLLGERLGAAGWAGSASILAGMLLAELRARAGTSPEEEEPAVTGRELPAPESRMS